MTVTFWSAAFTNTRTTASLGKKGRVVIPRPFLLVSAAFQAGSMPRMKECPLST
ncbi:predicted protein [Brucella sp. NVSL 07-0026]|nr:predicted protein [Brucella sp. NVSL 07-0026]